MAQEQKEVWSDCNRCKNNTKHAILFEHAHDTFHDASEPDFRETYQIVECKGCSNVALRYENEFFEAAYPDENDEWQVPSTVEIFPKAQEELSDLKGLHYAPDIVREIYNETLVALKEGSLVLAGIGFRAVIEAVCNEQSIKGKDLAARIDKLQKAGLISTKEAERLHAIRFLGNDAAHEIKKPTMNSLKVVLRIVEHLLATLYIIDHEAEGQLETMLHDYQKFKTLLGNHLSSFQKGDEYPLAKFLGKDVRRLSTSLPLMEKEILKEISSGAYTALTVGKISPFSGSQQPLQHFVKA